MKKLILLSALISFLYAEVVSSQSFNYPIVFVSRNHEINGNILYPQAGLLPGMGAFSRFKVVGGRLMMRDSLGNISVLIDSTMLFGDIRLIDVQQPCVHWNGKKILFAGIEHRDSNWRIYEVKLNSPRLSKLTFTNREINLSQFGNAAPKFVK